MMEGYRGMMVMLWGIVLTFAIVHFAAVQFFAVTGRLIP